MNYAPGVKLVKNVRIPMRDGVLLAADLYMPDDGSEGPYPVVMEHIPYRKDEVPTGVRFYSYFPQHGYIVARVDIRGTGASPGVAVDEYTLQEQIDGFDAIEWLAQQDFCDGNVNMMGISYGGFTSLQVATHQPPHLRSIIPVCFTDDRYTDDCHYRGGLLRQYYDVSSYGNFMIAYNALPPYPEFSDDWAEIWQEHLANNEPYLLKWLEHQTAGEYWATGSVGPIVDRITCPVFLIGGWRDGYPNPPLRLYEALQVPKKVWVGPWDHAYPDGGVPGPRVDHLREVVRWLDHWCKGSDTGIMEEPPVVVYVQHYDRPDSDRLDTPGEWRAETAWPAPGAADMAFHPAAGGALTTTADDGEDVFEYTPSVGITGGLWSAGVDFGLPMDQRMDEAFSLVYTTTALEQPVTVVGRAQLALRVSSTASVIGFAASLCDVAPDGSSHLVAKGMLNATRRDSFSDPTPIVPGEQYDLEIEIDCTAWRFEPGHRIRLVLASSDWPNVWPTPQPATNTVYRAGTRLVLPVVPDTGSAPSPVFEPSPSQPERHSLKADPPVWEVIRDALTRRARVEFKYGATDRMSPTTVVSREYQLMSQVDDDDPAGASAWGRHLSTINSSSGVVQACSVVTIQATAKQFHVVLDLTVHVNGMPHHTQQWTRSIPRQLL